MQQVDSKVFSILTSINKSCWEAQIRLNRLIIDQSETEEAIVAAVQKDVLGHIRAVTRTVNDDLHADKLCTSMALLLRTTREQAEKDLSRITCERDLLDAIIADLNQVDTQLYAYLPA